MKRICSDKASYGFWIFFTVFCLLSALGFLVLLLSLRSKEDYPLILALAPSLLLFFFSVGSLHCFNSECYDVMYDPETRTLSRKGPLSRKTYQVNFDDIKEVIISPMFRIPEAYVFIDSVNTKLERGHKESYISLVKRKESEIFVKEIWDKPMRKFKDYSEAFVTLKKEAEAAREEFKENV